MTQAQQSLTQASRLALMLWFIRYVPLIWNDLLAGTLTYRQEVDPPSQERAPTFIAHYVMRALLVVTIVHSHAFIAHRVRRTIPSFPTPSSALGVMGLLALGSAEIVESPHCG